MPKISVCMNTARHDHGLRFYPELHIFEYFMEGLRQQTFKDFEVVIADVLYDTRSDYFEKHPESFPVKHVPIKPNIWTPKNLIAISTTKNTCLLHAQGEIVVFTDDCSTFKPKHLEMVNNRMRPNLCLGSTYEVYCKGVFKGNCKRKGGKVDGLYGNVSLFLSDYIKLNGYDEMFDGSQGLEDCEFSRRAGRMGMELFLLDYPVTFDFQSGFCPPKSHTTRCPRLMEWISLHKRQHIIRANETPYSEGDFATMALCDTNHGKNHKCKWGGDFKCEGQHIGKSLSIIPGCLYLYKHPSLLFSLEEQRKNVAKAMSQLSTLVLT